MNKFSISIFNQSPHPTMHPSHYLYPLSTAEDQEAVSEWRKQIKTPKCWIQKKANQIPLSTHSRKKIPKTKEKRTINFK